MAAFKTDGTFTTATLCGPARKLFPIPGNNASFIVEQDFMIFFANFAPLALNTAHPTFTDAYLVSEGPLQDAGGGVARWTRTYAQVPASLSEVSGTHAYHFIGYDGNFFYVNLEGDPVAITGRERFTRSVPVLITRDYFLVDGVTYATSDDIPEVAGTEYVFQANTSIKADYLFDDIPLSGGAGTFLGTTPTRTAYEALIAADAFNIVVETSRLSRWMGNIFVRETQKVKAL